ncbi:hypothetical protein C8Q70DRAFT_1108269 [Cubamyces menziesii]|nr:hypothetical protein C8Q70DRAFT_1108269 [Cubamyces menziesii]
MEVHSVSTTCTTVSLPAIPYTPYLPPSYPVYFAPGLYRHRRGYFTDASDYTMSFTGAVAWIRYHDAFYASMAAHAEKPPSTSIEDAILRTPSSTSGSDEDLTLPQPSSEPLPTSSTPSLLPDTVAQAIEEALQSSCVSSLIEEPIPCFDDIPEIPDEDALPSAATSENQRHVQDSVESRVAVEDTPHDSTPAKPLKKAAQKSTVVVSEKPRRTAKGLVKQYRSGREKARPCAMGRTGLHTISEEETLDLSLTSPLVRTYKPRKTKTGRRERKDAMKKGDENTPLEVVQEKFASIPQLLATTPTADNLPRKTLWTMQAS